MRHTRLNLSSSRLSRREALKAGAAGLGAAAIALTGCGGKEDEVVEKATPGEQLTPQPGGVLTRGLIQSPRGLDPHIVTDYWVTAQFQSYLFMVNARDQSMMLQVAESFEQPDELTYLFKIKPGIKFHNVDPVNGREVTVDDVVYSFNRRRDDPAVENDKVLLNEFTDKFEAADSSTFRFVTKEPYGPALPTMGNASYAIVPKEAVEKFGDLQNHPVGCGPYILDQFVRGERISAVKNPDYFVDGRPYLDGREWMIIPDQSTILQAFRTQRHDFCGVDLDKVLLDQLVDPGIVVTRIRNLWYWKLCFNVTKPPFGDLRVRRAIDLAIDRQDLIDKIGFGEGKFAGPVSADMEYWSLSQDELRDFYKVDLTEAKSLLSAAGYEDGLEIDGPFMNVAKPEAKSMQIIKEHLAKIGINWKIQPTELGQYFTKLYGLDYEMTAYVDLPFTDPDLPLADWSTKGQIGVSWTGYSDPEADEWVRKTRIEVDREKRREVVLDAQRFFIRQHGPMLNPLTLAAWWAYWNWLHGLDENSGKGDWEYLGTDMWMTRRT